MERQLPIGATEFETLIQDLKAEYGEKLPTLDDDSLRFVVATTIMHLGPLDSHKSLEFFYKTIVSGAAKQVAHYIFREVKTRQEEAAKAASATPVESVVVDDSQKFVS
jgi:hypothetical protein